MRKIGFVGTTHCRTCAAVVKARSLHSVGISLPPYTHHQFVDECYCLPDNASPDAVVEKLLQARVDAVIYNVLGQEGDEATTVAFGASIREELGKHGIHVVAHPRPYADYAGDKLQMKKVFQQRSVPTLPFREIQSVADIAEATKAFGCPFVLKHPISSGGRGIMVVRSQTEAEGLLQNATGSLLAEPYVEGDEYSVDVFGCGSAWVSGPVVYKGSNTQSAHPLGRVKVAPAPAAPFTSEMQRVAVSAATALGAEGVLDFDFIVVDGSPFLLEINPRIGGGMVPMIRGSTGVHPYELLVDLALQQWHPAGDELRAEHIVAVVPTAGDLTASRERLYTLPWVLEARSNGPQNGGRLAIVAATPAELLARIKSVHEECGCALGLSELTKLYPGIKTC